jgi:acyl-CoA synthetase (AMP-forming)/AMP-acid ligase II
VAEVSCRRIYGDDAGPWFRTGDIVTIDADGFVSIVDRIKETGSSPVKFQCGAERGRRRPCGRIRPLRMSRSSACRATSGEEVVAAVVLTRRSGAGRAGPARFRAPEPRRIYSPC